MRAAFPLEERLEVSRTTPFARIRFLAICVIVVKPRQPAELDKKYEIKINSMHISS